MPHEKWLFIGDSLIEFFDWQKRFPNKEILNLGVAGETVEGLLSRLEVIVNRFTTPDLILIMTGTNNVGMEEFGFIGSYEKIIEMLIEHFPHSTVIVTSLLPIQLPWFSENTVPRVNIALQKMSRKMGVSFLDMYKCFTDDRNKTDKACFLEDGVHLTDYGYEVWAQAISQFLGSK